MIVTTNTTHEIPTRPGRDYQCSGLGNWDGAEVVLQTFVDAAWRDIADGSYTGDYGIVWTNGQGTALRASVSGVGGGTAISITFAEVP
jgi:hypothetical protein